MAAPFCRWPGMAGASRSGRTALRREGCSFRSQQSVPRLLSGHAVGGTRLCGMGHIRRRTAMRRHHIVGSPCRMQCHAACVLQAWFTLSESPHCRVTMPHAVPCSLRPAGLVHIIGAHCPCAGASSAMRGSPDRLGHRPPPPPRSPPPSGSIPRASPLRGGRGRAPGLPPSP
jgi:hypothetical protein